MSFFKVKPNIIQEIQRKPLELPASYIDNFLEKDLPDILKNPPNGVSVDDWKKAVAVERAQSLLAKHNRKETDNCVKEFREWIQGRHPIYNDKIKVPATFWGRKKLVGKDFDAYFTNIADKQFEFFLRIAELKMKIPSNLQEAWLYYLLFVYRWRDTNPPEWTYFDDMLQFWPGFNEGKWIRTKDQANNDDEYSHPSDVNQKFDIRLPSKESTHDAPRGFTVMKEHTGGNEDEPIDAIDADITEDLPPPIQPESSSTELVFSPEPSTADTPTELVDSNSRSISPIPGSATEETARHVSFADEPTETETEESISEEMSKGIETRFEKDKTSVEKFLAIKNPQSAEKAMEFVEIIGNIAFTAPRKYRARYEELYKRVLQKVRAVAASHAEHPYNTIVNRLVE